MRFVKTLSLVLVASSFVVVGLAGCGEKEKTPGDAIKDAGKQAKDVKDAAKDAAKDAGK